MTTLIQETQLSVTSNKGKPQVWLGASRLLVQAGFQPKKTYTIEEKEPGVMVLKITESGAIGKTYTVTAKGAKPMLDLKNLPDAIKEAEKVRVVYQQGVIVITVHHSEKLTQARETELVNTLSCGKKVKVGSIFTGQSMRDMLKRSGLVSLSNDISCKLAIEVSMDKLNNTLKDDPKLWSESSIAIVNNLTEVDVTGIDLPIINGLAINADAFDIRTNKKAGKTRVVSAADGYDEKGALFLMCIEVIKKANPAFVTIEVNTASQNLSKKEADERNVSYNTIMTVFSSVLNSLGYNIEQSIVEEADASYVNLVAVSKGLDKSLLEQHSVIDIADGNAQSFIQPTLVNNEQSKAKRVDERETNLLAKLKNDEPLEMGSVFSGGGILDRSLHEGLADMKLNSFCKFGMEWEEAYFMSNLINNKAVWRDNSFFFLGDVRSVNVYIRPLCSINGIALGIPCIGASRSGLVKNNISCAEQHEVAGALFVSALEIIKSANPAFIVIENVPDYQNTVSMEIVRSVLIHLGYTLNEIVASGNDFGALENRSRLMLVAVSSGLIEGAMLETLPAVEHKQACLNDIKEHVCKTSSSWSWRDYLDAKAVNDKAKGNNFDQQILSGQEPLCGTIGKSYMKARSTEPFFKFEEQERFRMLHESFLTSTEFQAFKSTFESAMEDTKDVVMYCNIASNMMSKENRRLGLKGEDKLESRLVTALSIVQTQGVKAVHELAYSIFSDACLAKELADTTMAISKATRLFTVSEHAAVKKVLVGLVDGVAATTAHEIMGNGVVFTKFQSLGRRIGAWLNNLKASNSVRLVPISALKRKGIEDDVELIDTGTGVVFHIVRNADTAYILTEEQADAQIAA